jgi:hypothetical protein
MSKKILSKEAHLTEKQVYRWFQYQKMKEAKPKSQSKLVQDTLISFFKNKSQYPTAIEIKDLAEETHKDIDYVRLWFTKKRYESKINY